MLDNLIKRYQSKYAPTVNPISAPPAGLWPFILYFLNQFRWAFGWRIILVGIGSVADALLPIFIGLIVGMISGVPAGTIFDDNWPILVAMAVITIVVRPVSFFFDALIRNHSLTPNLIDRIVWQSHFHVVRQSWSYFQNDFAGRIANKVIQAGDAIEDSVNMLIDAVWYALVLVVIALITLAGLDLWLLVPMTVWMGLFAILFLWAMPRIAKQSEIVSEAQSVLTGRVVDSYTNIHTVKTFANPRDEDMYVSESVDTHAAEMQKLMRLFTIMWTCLFFLNAVMLSALTWLTLALWNNGLLTAAAVAISIPFALQITNISGWILDIGSGVFRQLGKTRDSMLTISKPHTMSDVRQAKALEVTEGAIAFEKVTFNYWKGGKGQVVDAFDLEIAPGEKVGLVGRSGAGKSTLVNLLLRLFDVESGRVLIDGQDIQTVTQESLRAAIGLVGQDTSLLHRSVRANIKYGRPDASDDEMRQAARRARIDDTIEALVDPKGNRGYDALVGERGVKLSGGQRQRVAIARVLLKNAPILILDEATSALDSEVEAAIQEQFRALMAGKTVIAIAHRLSTIAAMDRLVIIDKGRVIETGSHSQLLALGGHYSSLWRRQSGGFLDVGDRQEGGVKTGPDPSGTGDPVGA